MKINTKQTNIQTSKHEKTNKQSNKQTETKQTKTKPTKTIQTNKHSMKIGYWCNNQVKTFFFPLNRCPVYETFNL